MRRFLYLTLFVLGLGFALGLSLRGTPVLAIGITGATATPSSTSAYVIVTTDVGGQVYWCIPTYNVQKFYGGTATSADCGAPKDDLNHGWVPGAAVVGTTAKFTVPHLSPSQFLSIQLSQTNGFIPPITYFDGGLVNVVTLPKLALTFGPTVTPPSPHVIGSTVPFAWDTNRVADSRVTYVGGGLGWRTLLSLGAGTNFQDVAMVGNSVGIAVAANGIVYRYFADSNDWLLATNANDDVGGADTLVSVAAGDAETFWVGSRGKIFFSDDGGRFFEQVYDVGFEFVDSLAAFGSTVAYASLSDGTMVKTTDAGITWTSVTLPAPNRLTRLVALDATHVWGAGWNGVIYRTDNGGAAWQDQSPGASSAFLDLSVIDSSNSVAVTATGQVWRTTNAGTSWVLVQTLPDTLYAVGMLSATEGWAFALGGRHYRTTDGWATQTSAVIGTSDTAAAAVVSSRHAITVGQNGFLSDYGPNYAAGTTNFNPALDTSHAASIANLPCQTSFFYRVGSDDGVSPNGSIVVSTDGVFTTGLCPDTDPPSVSFRARNLWTPPTPGTYTTNSTLTLRGDASDVAGGLGLSAVTMTHTRSAPPVVTTVATDPALTVGSFAYAWQKTVTLERGVNTFSAHAVDVGGNPNMAPDPSVSVTFDGDDPTVAIDPPNNVNRTVSAASLTVNGTAADLMPGSGLASATVRLNGSDVYTQNYAGGPAAGTWSTTPLTLLPNFANVIEVFATDVAGRRTTPAMSVTITYDSGGPTIANLTPVNNACTNTVPIPFTGQVTDPSGIGSITVTVNTVPIAVSIVPGGFTANLAAPPLIKGENNIVVLALDTLGNPSTQPHRLHYDPDPPTASIAQPADGSTVIVANQAVRGTVSDPNTLPATYSCGMRSLELSLNGAAYAPVNMAADPWTTVSLTPSIENTLQLRATDTANNRFVSLETHVTLDAAGPTNVEFTEVEGIPVPPLPPGPINVSVNTVTVRGTAQDDATLQTITVQRQGDGAIPVTAPPLPVSGSPASANWTGTIPNLQNGNNILMVTVTDNASHTTTDQIDVVYTPPDTTPPAVAPIGATSGTNCAVLPGVIFFDVSWTATDAESGVVQNTLRYRIQGSGDPWTSISQAAVPGPTQTVHVEPVTPNTNYEFEATSTDVAGNESAVLTFAARSADTCDTAGPTVVIEAPHNGDRVNDLVTITARVTDTRGVKDVTFFIDGNPQGPPINCVDILNPTDCLRTITWDTNSIIGPENHLIRAVGRDTSDNSDQDEVTVIVDNSRPVISNVHNDAPQESGGVWSVRVTWDTNVVADSAVHYSRERLDGGYMPYEDTESNPALVNNHEIILNNLQGNSIYHYQVESVDALGRRSQG